MHISREKTQVLCLNEEIAKKCADVERDCTVDMDLLAYVELLFKSQACLNGSFLLDDDKHFCCTSKHPGVDLKVANRAFNYLRKVENETLKSLVLFHAYRNIVHLNKYIGFLILDLGENNK